MCVSAYRDLHEDPSMTLSVGYITQKQTQIWNLRKKGLPEATIARKLNVTRQTVHKAIDVANGKIEQALIEAAKLSRTEVKNVDSVKGILTGYSLEFGTQVIVTFSANNGIQVWYKHEGNCRNCDNLGKCWNTLLVEIEDRNIQLHGDFESFPPSKLAELLFKKIMDE